LGGEVFHEMHPILIQEESPEGGAKEALLMRWRISDHAGRGE